MVDLQHQPAWAVATFAGVVVFIIYFALVQRHFERRRRDEKEKDVGKSRRVISGNGAPRFRRFQRKYLVVTGMVTLAEWMQMMNTRVLYASYGLDAKVWIRQGLVVSLFLGTAVGIHVDNWGRRFSCMVYLWLEIISLVCESFNSVPLLIVSQLSNGVSTSLLFTTFESWMVSEHRAQGFESDWLADTFGWTSIVNGVSAIVARFLVEVTREYGGHTGPSLACVFAILLASPIVHTFTENYGEDSMKLLEEEDKPHAVKTGATDVDEADMDEDWSTSFDSLDLILKNKPVRMLALSLSCFEAGLHCFSLTWTLKLTKLLGSSPLPEGLIFSCLASCLSLGGLLFATMRRSPGVEWGSFYVLFIAAFSLQIFRITDSLVCVLAGFIVFATCVGIFLPIAGYLRSKLLPDHLQATVVSLCRIPTSLLVVVATLLPEAFSADTCFCFISLWLVTGAAVQMMFADTMRKEALAIAADMVYKKLK